MKSLSRIIAFLRADIWRIRLDGASLSTCLIVKPLRVLMLAVRGFDEDRCSLKASALTFYTLLSLVPVAAMAFGIAKGFGFEKLLEQQLLEKFHGHEEVLSQVIEFARTMLDNTRGGLIAGIGVAVLFWSVIKLLGNIEHSFNDIWGIEKSRSLARKFSDYLSAMLVCPILFLITSSMTVALAARATLVLDRLQPLQAFGPLVHASLALLPYVLIWFLFTFLYIFMPNTRVRFTSSLLGGIAAGTLYKIVQYAYVSFQFGIAKHNAIYGGFAALPLFLVWLQISWLIVLFGAEISFAHQNADTYEFEPDCLQASHAFKQLLALRIVHQIVHAFQCGSPPLTAAAIVKRLEVPVRLVQQLLDQLVACTIISEVVCPQNKTLAYQPATSIERLTIRHVIDALERHGVNTLPVASTSERAALQASLDAMHTAFTRSPDNILVKDVPAAGLRHSVEKTDSPT